MTRTSRTHPLQIAAVSAGLGFGRIGLTFCPGKHDDGALSGPWRRDLDLDLDVVRDWGAAAVVTLCSLRDLTALRVQGLGLEVERRHMDWVHLPVAEDALPGSAFEAAWVAAGEGLRTRLRDGFDVVLHGHGLDRTGAVAARLLVELGVEPSEALRTVRRARSKALANSHHAAWALGHRIQSAAQPEETAAAIRDRALGGMLGLAVGDAIGTTLEFSVRDDDAPRHEDMTGGGPFRLAPGEWTDDTAMAVALAASLAATSSFDAQDLASRFVRWYRQGHYASNGRCFDIGNVTRAALERFERTGDPESGSTDPNSAGNGSLMRLAPVAIRHWNDREKRRDVAARQSRTTHGAPEAVDACVLYVDILADAIAGKPRAAVLAPRPERLASAIATIAAGHWRGKSRHKIRGSGYVVHSLEAALWCVGRTADFRSAVLMAANLREDADTTAAITGQLAGALYGAAGIPRPWLDRLAHGERIARLAGKLVDQSMLRAISA